LIFFLMLAVGKRKRKQKLWGLPEEGREGKKHPFYPSRRGERKERNGTPLGRGGEKRKKKTASCPPHGEGELKEESGFLHYSDGGQGGKKKRKRLGGTLGGGGEKGG